MVGFTIFRLRAENRTSGGAEHAGGDPVSQSVTVHDGHLAITPTVGRTHGHDHDHGHELRDGNGHDQHHHHDHDHDHTDGDDDGHGHHHHEHGHGHVHTVPDDLSWRSIAAVGVSGGLIPCPSALVVLLVAVALHRLAFGFALILAFSIGLAAVISGIGLTALYARPLYLAKTRLAPPDITQQTDPPEEVGSGRGRIGKAWPSKS